MRLVGRRETPVRMLPQPDWWQQLLEPGESVSTTIPVGHHWVAHTKAFLYGVVSVLSLVLAVLKMGQEVSGFLSLVWIAAGAWSWLLWQTTKNDKLIVTSVRVFKLNGLFSKTMAAMPLSKLVDLTVHEPLLGRLLGYGHFTFESAAQKQGLDSFRTVGGVLELSKEIQSRAHAGALRSAEQARVVRGRTG